MKKVKIKDFDFGLNIQQMQFCYYYVFGYECVKEEDNFRMGNGMRSYALAYGYKEIDDEVNDACRAKASLLLTKVNILKYIDKLLAENGFNDAIADSRLRDIMINGSNIESVQAIREYNKLKQRIIDKMHVIHDVITGAKVEIIEKKK